MSVRLFIKLFVDVVKICINKTAKIRMGNYFLIIEKISIVILRKIT